MPSVHISLEHRWGDMEDFPAPNVCRTAIPQGYIQEGLTCPLLLPRLLPWSRRQSLHTAACRSSVSCNPLKLPSCSFKLYSNKNTHVYPLKLPVDLPSRGREMSVDPLLNLLQWLTCPRTSKPLRALPWSWLGVDKDLTIKFYIDRDLTITSYRNRRKGSWKAKSD